MLSRLSLMYHRAVAPVLTLLYALIWSAPLSAALSLTEAFDLALSHDAEIAAARERNSAEKEIYDQTLARLLPTLQMDASHGVADYDRGYGVSRAYDNDRIGLNLIQPVFQREYWYRLGQAKSRVQVSDLDLADKVQTIGLDVATAYFAILLAQRNVDLARAETESYQQLREKISRELERGFSTRTDLLDANARFDQAQAQVLIALKDLETARLRLQLRIGRVPNDVKLDQLKLAEYVPQPVNETAWLERIKSGNLTIRKAFLNLDIADTERETQTSGHYPRVNLRASMSNSYNEDKTQIQGDDARISLEFTLPLYEGGGTASRIRQAAFSYSEAQQTLRAAQERGQLDGSRVLEELTTAQASVVALKSSVASWGAFVEAAEKTYNLGLKDLFTVLDARARLFVAERDLASRIHDELLSRLRLHALAGELDRERVTGVDELLAGQQKPPPQTKTLPGAAIKKP